MGVASESGTLRGMVFDVAPSQTAGGTRSYLRTDLLGAAFALFAGITLVAVYAVRAPSYSGPLSSTLVNVMGVSGAVIGGGLLFLGLRSSKSVPRLVSGLEIDRATICVRFFEQETRAFSWSAHNFRVLVVWPRHRTASSHSMVVVPSCPPAFLTIDRADQLVAFSRSIGLQVDDSGGGGAHLVIRGRSPDT